MATTNGISNYDFIELKVYDVHGYTKGRLISKSRVPSVIKNGMGLCGGLCFHGVNGQRNTNPAFQKGLNFQNHNVVPILSTLKPCMKAVSGDRKLGSVLCEIRKPDGTLDTSTPREATQSLLQQLESEFGLRIKSSFEAEFCVKDSQSKTPYGHMYKWGSLAILESSQDVLLGLLDSLHEIGVKIDTLIPERGPGQFEVTFDVAEGIEAPDMAAEFKTATYVYLKSRGYDADFMSCGELTNKNPCGYHFNHSLWDKDNRNIFVDPVDDTKLSDFGRHWLAGLIEHSRAMTAFCSPTINCYRRIGVNWSPTYANWAQEDRTGSYRVKVEPNSNVYLENRMPSSACNPHLVLACTLAAGMDGVRRKLELSEPLSKKIQLPNSLDEALQALQEDTVFTEALGPTLVDFYVSTKQKFEVEEFQKYSWMSPEELLKKEKEYYYELA